MAPFNMLNKEEFQSIIRKYLSGESTPEEEQLIERWYSNITESKDELDYVEKIALRKRIRAKLKITKQGRVSENNAYSFFNFLERFMPQPKLAIALPIVMVAIGAIFFFTTFPSSHQTKQASEILERLENTKGTVKSFQLADGSTVNLDPGAVLEIGSFAVNNREVFLRKGQVFFDVQRDEARPFVVYTNKIVVRVLGTSFLIQTEEKDVTVSVKTGKVSVTKQSDPRSKNEIAEIVLTANQKAVFDAQENKLSKNLVDKPQMIIPAEDLQLKSFEETPVPIILESVERAYGVDIEFNAAKLATCRLTTYLTNKETLYDRLEIICSAIGATYTVEGTQVTINSQGCGAEVKDSQNIK